MCAQSGASQTVFCVLRPSESGRSPSQAAVLVDEAGEHALVGKVAVAIKLTENVALPGREVDTEPDIGAATRLVIFSRSSDRTREPCRCRGHVPG